MSTGIERVNNFYALVAAIWRPFGAFLLTAASILGAIVFGAFIVSSVFLAIALPVGGIIFLFLAFQCAAIGVCP